MADAKIVDIKGVQWELKDEVARNRIAELEKSLIPQSLENIGINLDVGFTAVEAIISEHYKVGKIHFARVLLRNISGGKIGTSETVRIGTINIRPKKETTFLLNDYENNAILRCFLSNDGAVSAAESIGVVQGKNICLGEIIFAEE